MRYYFNIFNNTTINIGSPWKFGETKEKEWIEFDKNGRPTLLQLKHCYSDDEITDWFLTTKYYNDFVACFKEKTTPDGFFIYELSYSPESFNGILFEWLKEIKAKKEFDETTKNFQKLKNFPNVEKKLATFLYELSYGSNDSELVIVALRNIMSQPPFKSEMSKEEKHYEYLVWLRAAGYLDKEIYIWKPFFAKNNLKIKKEI